MLKIIKRRRSIRTYQPKPVEDKKLDEILKAVMFSPSAHNLRPWEIIIIKNSEAKIKLSKVTPWSEFAKDAPVVLALCGDEKKSVYWIEDCSIAAEAIYLETTNQGLGTCMIQIFDIKNNEGKISEELVRNIIHIPAHIRILCLFPIGYPAETKAEHTDSEFDQKKIHQEKF
jgi:nitroreductase